MQTLDPLKTSSHTFPLEVIISSQSSILVEVVPGTYSPAAEVDGSAPT
jgi:hypothetical protein